MLPKEGDKQFVRSCKSGEKETYKKVNLAHQVQISPKLLAMQLKKNIGFHFLNENYLAL